MKTEYQVQHFFTSQQFKSETDWEIVQLFCQKRHIRVGTFQPLYYPDGITGDQFIRWYQEGYACGDVVLFQGEPAIISKSGLEISELLTKISTNPLNFSKTSSQNAELEPLDDTQQFDFHTQLSHKGFEFNRNKLTIVKKWTPTVNDRVLYYNQNESGLGVVRSILPADNKVELYCYYSYTTKQCGYSMHEANTCTFHEFHFEPMTIVAQRRLNRELERYGKVWYDKLHRIEPLQVKVDVGRPYWYISDKMKVVQEREKGTPTSQFRYIAGNYFSSHEAALEALDHISDYLRDRLAE